MTATGRERLRAEQRYADTCHASQFIQSRQEIPVHVAVVDREPGRFALDPLLIPP